MFSGFQGIPSSISFYSPPPTPLLAPLKIIQVITENWYHSFDMIFWCFRSPLLCDFNFNPSVKQKSSRNWKIIVQATNKRSYYLNCQMAA